METSRAKSSSTNATELASSRQTCVPSSDSAVSVTGATDIDEKARNTRKSAISSLQKDLVATFIALPKTLNQRPCEAGSTYQQCNVRKEATQC